MTRYFKLMRMRHYVKNLLVLIPLACSGQFLLPAKLLASLEAFFIFSVLSSAVYVINDIRDLEKDRFQPTKCKRPLASGEVSVRSAIILLLLLLLIVIIFSTLFCQPSATVLLILYFSLNSAYSFGLKDVPLVDVAILASGFWIRIWYGAIVTGIAISNWLYLTVIALAFYCGLGKRRNEQRQLRTESTRRVLKAYPRSFLDKNMNMCLTLANVFYALWSMDETTIELYRNRPVIFTVPIVLLITMKYSMNIEGDSNGDPVEVFFHDKVLLFLCAVYILIMFIILYL